MSVNAIIAKINYIAEKRRRLQAARPLSVFTDEERAYEQGNLQLLPLSTPAINSSTRCMRLSDVLEELHDVRLPQIPVESLRFHVYEILRNATAAFNGTCGEHLPNPANAILREDLDSLTCNFPCKKCGTRPHNLNQHLINKYKSHLLYPHAPLLDFAYGKKQQLIITMEQTWVEIPRVPIANKGLTWRDLAQRYPMATDFNFGSFDS